MSDTANADAVELATALTVAWLGNSNTRTHAEDVPAFLVSIHNAIIAIASIPAATENGAQQFTPAVSARKSLASPDHIISMIDGKPYRSLTRHLRNHGLTPGEYRSRFGLKAEYPMIAPSYSEARSAMAKARNFGRKAGHRVEEAVETATKATRRSGKAALDAARKALGTAE